MRTHDFVDDDLNSCELLNSIPGVSGASAGNEAAYRAAIAANDPALTNPATAIEVQALVTAVNKWHCSCPTSEPMPAI